MKPLLSASSFDPNPESCTNRDWRYRRQLRSSKTNEEIRHAFDNLPHQFKQCLQFPQRPPADYQLEDSQSAVFGLFDALPNVLPITRSFSTSSCSSAAERFHVLDIILRTRNCVGQHTKRCK